MFTLARHCHNECYNGGYSPNILLCPQEVEKRVHVMLQKQAGNLSMGKLWVVVLFEADFNMNNVDRASSNMQQKKCEP